MRTVISSLLRLSLPVLVAACAAFSTAACAPARALVADGGGLLGAALPAPVERRAVRGLESTCAAGSIVWILPVRGGVVLVDAGFDEAGARIHEALRGRRVLAVLLTHGHLDHRAAAHLFGAPVYVGRGDLDLVTGARGSKAVIGVVGDALGRPPPPRTLLPVDDGTTLVIGGRTFTAVALPGHTAGSTGWLTSRLLFTGDAIQGPLGDGELWPAPPTVTDDMRLAYRSMRRLLALEADLVLDGHFGATADPQGAARRAIARAHDETALWDHPVLRPAGCREDDVVPR
jgi:hydroxyacylglutathione hydrolase